MGHPPRRRCTSLATKRSQRSDRSFTRTPSTQPCSPSRGCRSLRASSEFTVYVGGEVAVTEYAPSGPAPRWATRSSASLTGETALLANHGMVAVGKDPANVLHVTAMVERATMIVAGVQALGGPHKLPDKVNSDFHGVYKYLRTN